MQHLSIDCTIVVNEQDGEGTVREEQIAIVRTMADDGMGKVIKLC